jgi:hypothetical protein
LPQSWNRYTYTANDPINAKDPLGLFLGWDDGQLNPCGSGGPIILLDGIQLFSSTRCFPNVGGGFSSGTEPGQRSKPACSFSFRFDGSTSGYLVNGVTRDPNIDPNQTPLGPYPASLTHWAYIFEGRVNYSYIPNNWRFLFKLRVIGSYKYLSLSDGVGNLKEGSTDQLVDDDFPFEGNIKRDGAGFFWWDTPSTARRTPSGDPLIHGYLFFDFTFLAIDSNGDVGCSANVRLRLTITEGQGIWDLPVVQ